MDRSDAVEKQRLRVAEFVRHELIPRERGAFTHFDDSLRRELQPLAQSAGLWAPQLPVELSGGGYTFWESAVLFEEAGTSLLGPLSLGIAAPDEGNCHLLARVADPEQRERYLVPWPPGRSVPASP